MPDRREDVERKLRTLGVEQVAMVGAIIDAMTVPVMITRLPTSDIASEQVVAVFADLLRIHHALSAEPFTKDKFEHAMQRALSSTGRKVELARRTNPGRDLIVDDVAWSLKTQADAGIRRDRIHISKFMELGKGEWVDAGHLAGLRNRMLEHMNSYERIISLRCLSQNAKNGCATAHEYELVEIPKSLLQQASRANLRMVDTSKQSPKPGYGEVRDELGKPMFALYFDGGTERKLQIKDIDKSHCIVHATWAFNGPTAA
jgi:hypothetical protein